ncbi:MAG TPA: c-type cytochrome domain-containing protein [Isosphaeraceae bacterium]|jgi:WD40 repeat protein|nr:c-type cytochrome domain-containing protein [Isosphaeraceae bacterium]
MTFPALVLALALPADGPTVRFRKDVAPILVKKCLGCHNEEKAKNGLNMATFELLKKGGTASGAEILVAGDPDASALVESIRADAQPRMPYKLPPLSDAEIAVIERWVKGGAMFDGPAESARLAELVDPLADLPKVRLTATVAEPIVAVAFAPDGKAIAAGQGGKLLLFDAGTNRLVHMFEGHLGAINAVRFTTDGKRVVAAGGRPGMFGAITAWDLATKARTLQLRGHADAILAADLAPDGKTLATASYDRLVKLWDLDAGKELRTLKEHTDAVYAVAFAPDGKTLVSASGDRTAKVWDVATGKRLVTLSGATAELYAVAFGPDGRLVVAGGVDRSIRAWSLRGESAELVRSVFAHDAAVVRLVVAPDSKTLYSSGEDRDVKAWDLATLEPIAAISDQPDWPQAVAVAPDNKRLAVGRYDGSLALFDPASRKAVATLRDAPRNENTSKDGRPAPARSATLERPSPRGGSRGTTVRVDLRGRGVGRADFVVFDEPGLTATILPNEKDEPDHVKIEVTIAPGVSVGVHRLRVRTPLGVPPSQPFAVSAYPEVAEAGGKPVSLPATLVGAIDKPGDVDHFQFAAKAGEVIVFEATTRSNGSALDATLSVLDDRGRVVAEATGAGDEPILRFQAPRDGDWTLRVADAEAGGSTNHDYRIQAGKTPMASWWLPLAIRAGESANVSFFGGLAEGTPFAGVTAPATAAPGELLSAQPSATGSHWAGPMPKVVVVEGPQAEEGGGQDQPSEALSIEVPGGVSGFIERSGDVDFYAFEAKKHERRIVEVFGRRLGSPIDPVIEVLDADGKPLPRAVLRPVAETTIAFRDHGSMGRNIRLVDWKELAVGDFLLAGRELMRLAELPRNPDDDAVFEGQGFARFNSGERVAYLGTTPEQHPFSQPLYKVEVHPPGATFPPGGVPPVTLYYRNDDGGPGLGKDSLVEFDPPADGRYLVRVEDVRGLGGDEFAYHLVVRRPRPDFTLSLSTDDPNVPRGGAAIVTATIVRRDGFDGAVDVRAESLPPGITATTARIAPGATSADFVLSADPDAPATSPPSWRVVAEAGPIRHEYDPGGPRGGWVAVTPAPELKVEAKPARVAIRPGEKVSFTFKVDRAGGLSGRVPIDVRNLPADVRVLDIGLNGVLVTEVQVERAVVLYADPRARAGARPFYASARLELLGEARGGNGRPVIDATRSFASAPILLEVLPPSATTAATAAARRP